MKKSNQAIYYETLNGVTEIFFNRPEKLNPQDHETSVLFAEIINQIKNETSQVVIITGHGRAFSAGGNLDFLTNCTKSPSKVVEKRLNEFYQNFLKIRELPQVTIAKINGPVVGGLIGLVLACDFRVIVSSAKISFNFVKLGINPGMGVWPLARNVIGETAAKQALLLGEVMSGQKFFDLGGAYEIADSIEHLNHITKKLTDSILKNSSLSIKFLKEEMQLEDEMLKTYIKFEAQKQALAFQGPDASEGIHAAIEKREPRFLTFAKSHSFTPLPHDDKLDAGFHVPYFVKDCEYGKGLFAAIDIPAGTLIWKYRAGTVGTPGINVVQYKSEKETLARLKLFSTSEERFFWLDHAYAFNGSVNEILDDGGLWNHSDSPNTGIGPTGPGYDMESTYSLQDIKAGEQFLDDYGYYEYPGWFEKLCEKEGCHRNYVTKKNPP